MRRRWVRIVLGVVVVFVLAIVAVRVFVPAEKWMRLAFEQVEKQTGLVADATEAHVSFPWPVGLRLKNLTVEGPKDSPDGSRLECAAEDVVVVADLGSLLRGRPNVKEVRLAKPQVEVWLPETPATKAEAAGDGGAGVSSGSGPVAVLGLVSIEDGRLVLNDPRGQRMEFEGLQNRARVDLDGERFRADLQGSWRRFVLTGDSIPRPVTLPELRWDTKLEGPIDGTELRFDIGSVAMAELQGRGPATLKLTGEAPTLEAQLDLEGDVQPLYEQLARPFLEAPDAIPAPWRVEDLAVLGGRVTGSATWNGPLPGTDPQAPLSGLNGTLDLKGLVLRLLERNEWPKLDARLDVVAGELRVQDIRGAGAIGTVAGGFTLPLAPNGALAGTFDLDLQARVLRDIAESAWPRLAETAGPDAAGPETWPGLGGVVGGTLRLDLPLGPTEGELPPESVQWTTKRWKLAALLPSLRDSVRWSGGTLQANLERAAFEGVRVAGPGFETLVQGTADGWPETTRLRGRLDMDRFDLDAFQAAAKSEEHASAAAVDWPWSVRPAHAQSTTTMPPPPANLVLDLDVAAAKVMASGYTLERVRGKAELLEQKMQLKDLRGSLATGQLRGAGEVDWTVDPPQWTGDARADSIPAGALLAPFAPTLASALSTEFSGTVDLGGALATETEQILQALTGLAELRSGNGKLTTETILGPRVSEFLGARADRWRNLDFRSLVADVKVENGGVVFERMVVSGETGVSVGGRIGFDGRADYRLDVLLPPGVTPELGALAPLADLLRDGQGRIGFGAKVTGPVGKPKVEIDFAQLEAKAKAKGEDKARSLLEQGLEDLRRRGAEAAGDSTLANPETDLGKKAEEAAKDLLRRFGGGKKGGGGER